MIDALGNVVPDSILAILALRALNLYSGVAVISENTSMAVVEEAEALGLRVLRSRVGKTFAVLEVEGGLLVRRRAVQRRRRGWGRRPRRSP